MARRNGAAARPGTVYGSAASATALAVLLALGTMLLLQLRGAEAYTALTGWKGGRSTYYGQYDGAGGTVNSKARAHPGRPRPLRRARPIDLRPIAAALLAARAPKIRAPTPRGGGRPPRIVRGAQPAARISAAGPALRARPGQSTRPVSTTFADAGVPHSPPPPLQNIGSCGYGYIPRASMPFGYVAAPVRSAKVRRPAAPELAPGLARRRLVSIRSSRVPPPPRHSCHRSWTCTPACAAPATRSNAPARPRATTSGPATAHRAPWWFRRARRRRPQPRHSKTLASTRASPRSPLPLHKVTDSCPCYQPGNQMSNARWCCGDQVSRSC